MSTSFDDSDFVDADYQTAKSAAQIVLGMDSVGEIKRYLFEQIRQLGMVELLEMYH